MLSEKEFNRIRAFASYEECCAYYEPCEKTVVVKAMTDEEWLATIKAEIPDADELADKDLLTALNAYKSHANAHIGGVKEIMGEHTRQYMQARDDGKPMQHDVNGQILQAEGRGEKRMKDRNARLLAEARAANEAEAELEALAEDARGEIED